MTAADLRRTAARTASSAALLGAAVILVGCEEQGPGGDDLSGSEGQFSTTQTPLDEMDPNELPPGTTGEDETMGDSRLNDGTRESAEGDNEYDTTPLTPGETDS